MNSPTIVIGYGITSAFAYEFYKPFVTDKSVARNHWINGQYQSAFISYLYGPYGIYAMITGMGYYTAVSQVGQWHGPTRRVMGTTKMHTFVLGVFGMHMLFDIARLKLGY